MNIKDVLKKIRDGQIDIEAALLLLQSQPASGELEFANVDHDRFRRCGFPEFVFGEGKTASQIRDIVNEIYSKKMPVLVTRLSEEKFLEIKENLPVGFYDRLGKTFTVAQKPDNDVLNKQDEILVVTAGTSDIPVALEASNTAKSCGCNVRELFDVGVAGIHRLVKNIDMLRNAKVLIVVAGMEGALPSVVAGLVACPVIAVPTSVGYGASLNGLTAMFSMLNSCASGVTVSNIDNGFGAGCAAARIINSIKR